MKQKMLNWIYKAIRYSYNTIISCISKNQTIKLIMAYRDIRKQHLLNEEKHISNFLKPIYYIIRYDDVMSCGWTVWERVALYGAIYAEDHHMIPVMDMQSKSNMYLEDWEIGEKNAWEKYYFQLGGVSYEDAIKSNNFILADSSQKWFEYVRMRSPKRFNKDYLRKKYNQYIRLNGITLNKLEENYKQIIPPEGGKIAGLCVRGTDYRLFHHPLQPDTSILVDETKHVMKEYDCKYVFILRSLSYDHPLLNKG